MMCSDCGFSLIGDERTCPECGEMQDVTPRGFLP